MFTDEDVGRGRKASSSATLKDAMNEALRDWVSNAHDTYYHRHGGRSASYPAMVRIFSR